MEDQRDEQLWRIARKRAQFRRRLSSYIIVNAFLWLVWWFIEGSKGNFHGFPWPLWIMLAWGLRLAIRYYEAYHGTESDLAEREYEKLKREGR